MGIAIRAKLYRVKLLVGIAVLAHGGVALAEGRDLPTLTAYDPSAIQAKAPGGYSAAPIATGATLAVGSEVASGDRECRVGDGAAVATTPGAMTVVCGGTRGQPRTEIPVIVAPVVVAAELRPIEVAVPTLVHITVASVATLGADLRVAASDPNLVLKGLTRTPRGLDMTVVAAAEGPYAIAVTTPAGVELGRVDAEVVAAGRPHTETRTLGEVVDWRAVDIGALLGFFAPPSLDGASNATIGHPKTPGDAVGWGPELGLRLGLFPTRRVGLELEGALATTGYVEQPGVSAVLVSRAQLAVRAIEDGAYGLRIVAGADLLAELVDRGSSHRGATGGVHYGAAFTIEAHRDAWLRFEALHVILPSGTGGYASCFEAQLGVVTRLGRRDAW